MITRMLVLITTQKVILVANLKGTGGPEIDTATERNAAKTRSPLHSEYSAFLWRNVSFLMQLINARNYAAAAKLHAQ